MADYQYQRLSVFREGTMRRNTFNDDAWSRLLSGHSTPTYNHKPRILRILSLLSLFIVTIALIGLLQYAVMELPHGASAHRGQSAVLATAKRDASGLRARDDSSSSTVIIASATQSDYVQTQTTQTITTTTASGVVSEDNVDATNYVSMDATQTIGTTTSPRTLMIMSQSDYVATDTTQTLPTLGSSVDQTNYISTDATQTVSTLPAIVYTAAQTGYVPTDTTQTFTPSQTIAYSAAPSDYVPTATTQTLATSVDPNIMTTGDYVPPATTQTIPLSHQDDHNSVTNTQQPSVTTIPSATLVVVPISSSSTGTTIYTTTRRGQVYVTTGTVVRPVSILGAGSTQVTSWTQIVQTVTPGVFTTVLGGSTTIFSTNGATYTSVLGESTVVSSGSAGATSTSDDGASRLSDNSFGKAATIIHHWNDEQTFLGTYLAVLIAVLYRMIWTVINKNFNLIEPFRQLNKSNGALAEHAFFSFYQTQSNLLGPLPALLKRRWGLALVGTTYLVACFMPALSSEAIYVDTDWGCPHPMEGKNPCQARMTANVTVLRVLQGLLAFAALVLMALTPVLLFTKTGLPADPSSMATVALLMRNPALLDDLNEVPADADAKHMMHAMAGRRYRLGSYKTASGEPGYGIVPAYDSGQDVQHHTHGYTPVAGATTASSSHRIRFMDFVLASVVLGTFGVVLAYYFDGNHDGFNDYFSSNTFGPRFILTGAATVVASLWKSVEQSAVAMAPYTRLAHHPSSARSTILFTPHNTPVLSTVSAVWNRYFLVATITFVTLTAEALNIVISGVPYTTGQTWMQFLVSIYMSIAILGLMVAVVTIVILLRRREPKMPRKPDTVGAVMSYMSAGRVLHDFEGVDWQDGEARDRRIRLVGKRYTFEERSRQNGKHAWTVDEVYE